MTKLKVSIPTMNPKVKRAYDHGDNIFLPADVQEELKHGKYARAYKMLSHHLPDTYLMETVVELSQNPTGPSSSLTHIAYEYDLIEFFNS